MPPDADNPAAQAFHYAAYTIDRRPVPGRQWRSSPTRSSSPSRIHRPPLRREPPQSGAYTLSGASLGTQRHKLLFGRPLATATIWTRDRLGAGHRLRRARLRHRHTQPAGFAYGGLAKAARRARGRPRGCFRGNRANRGGRRRRGVFRGKFVSCIAAPEFSPKALQLLKTKKDIRLVTLPSRLIAANELDLRAVAGGMLVQERDQRPFLGDMKTASKRAPTEREMAGLVVAWHTAMHAHTHAAVIARGTSVIGVGSGQTSRLDSVRLALVKSQERHPIIAAGEPVVMATDGALTAEHVHAAAEGGVTAVIHPGGAAEDKDDGDAAERHGMALVATGVRHFRH